VQFGGKGVAGLRVSVTDLPNQVRRDQTTSVIDGRWAIPVLSPGQFRVEFPKSHMLLDGREVYLKGPHTFYCQANPGKGSQLPDVVYELRGAELAEWSNAELRLPVRPSGA